MTVDVTLARALAGPPGGALGGIVHSRAAYDVSRPRVGPAVDAAELSAGRPASEQPGPELPAAFCERPAADPCRPPAPAGRRGGQRLSDAEAGANRSRPAAAFAPTRRLLRLRERREPSGGARGHVRVRATMRAAGARGLPAGPAGPGRRRRRRIRHGRRARGPPRRSRQARPPWRSREPGGRRRRRQSGRGTRCPAR